MNIEVDTVFSSLYSMVRGLPAGAWQTISNRYLQGGVENL